MHYHFASRDEMEAAIAAGGFLEYAEVHGNLYGTSIDAIRSLIDSRRVCVLDIDVQVRCWARRLCGLFGSFVISAKHVPGFHRRYLAVALVLEW